LPTQVAGYANTESKKPITTSTVFEAASLSKPVVAFAVLQLVDRGLISLDAPVARYIRVVELSPDPRWNALTVRMLLNHTSGLPNEIRSGEKLSFAFEPGSRFSYSGTGFLLLQRIIEAVTYQTFDSYMKHAVFSPLKMKSSSFTWRLDYEHRKANGHSNINKPTDLRRPLHARASSSLHTTADDYARFLQAVLLHRGLRSSTWKLMVNHQSPVQADCVVCIGRPIEVTAANLSWGLGWGLEVVRSGSKLFHWGENNGDFQAFVEGETSAKNGIIILTNSGNGLSIVPTLVQSIFPGKHPAFSWMGYDEVDSRSRTVLRSIVKQGAEAVLEVELPTLSEAQWNRIGYNLLARDRVIDAIKVFELNVRLFPNSANVYDSLGEAYAAAHRSRDAVASYRKSLELDKNNENAREMLKRLEGHDSAIQRRCHSSIRLRASRIQHHAKALLQGMRGNWPRIQSTKKVNDTFLNTLSKRTDGMDRSMDVLKTLEKQMLAERQGFEPWIRFHVYTLSKRAPSATRPSLRL
jgi:CubicO group peptidase (beta-lactamase class C family)